MRTPGMSLHKLPLKNIINFSKNNFNNKNNYSTNYDKKNFNNDNFLEWFVGFSDGESNFTIGIDERLKLTRFNFRFLIGLHIDDRPLLEYIHLKLGCGKVSNNKENTASYFIISDVSEIKSILLPIFDNFPLNTTKHLDYLCFKEAINIDLKKIKEPEIRKKMVNHIIHLKNNMNKYRENFELPSDHIRITPYWLLGLIEGEGSFHLRRKTLTPTFSLTLTITQKPVILKIVSFLIDNLDEYSKFKAINSKIFNLSEEKAIGSIKPKIKLVIIQIDYLHNIFIPFLNNLNFLSKKSKDFYDFKLLTKLIYQGKFVNPDVKNFILKISYTMNNYRLSNNKNNPLISTIASSSSYGEKKEELKEVYFSSYEEFKYWNLNRLELENKFINLPSLYVKNNNGQIININTNSIVRDIYIIEVVKSNNNRIFFPTISDCSKELSINKDKIYRLISNGKSLDDLSILKINKIRVFNRLDN
jgi:hypothetical protein